MPTPTVLVVDDEPNVAEAYDLFLPDEYETRIATGGEEALDRMDEDVDVVLLDRRMPDLTGDEVLERVREAGYDARVAMVTAVDPTLDVLAFGFDDYLVKPVDRDDVRGTVEDLLAIGEYTDAVREYFTLAKKRATIEDAMPVRELEADDRYQDLVDRTDELKARVDESFDDLDDEAQTGTFHQFPGHD
ncbi:response regulator [Halorubellus sp. PRR65]|uniref:response regulator n=1 Tax=Halorubellus sp. PRR65 TaxID=3098148 RepID=UPI002B264089|nr:response regulator [Halorubellus sp. PRR65]